MKKLLILISGILIFVIAPADALEIYNLEKEIIASKIERLNLQKELRYSRVEEKYLKKEEILKELELSKEIKKIRLDYADLENKSLKIKRMIDSIELKRKEYNNKLDVLSKNRDSVKEIELINVKYMVEYFDENFKQQNREKEFIEKRLAENRYKQIEKAGKVKIREYTSKSYDLIIDGLAQELLVYKSEKRGKEEFVLKEKEIRLYEMKKNEELKNYDVEIERKQKNLENLKSSKYLLTLEINMKKREIDEERRKVELGIGSRQDYFKKDMEYFELMIKDIEIDGAVNSLEMEIAE